MSYQIDITLNGKTETLKTSLRAARAVNGTFGNFLDALGDLKKFNLVAYTVIIAAGLDKKPSDVEESVYDNGLVDLLDPLAKFVNSLAQGGRDPDVKTEASGSAGKQ